jgi:hypothetical protein
MDTAYSLACDSLVLLAPSFEKMVSSPLSGLGTLSKMSRPQIPSLLLDFLFFCSESPEYINTQYHTVNVVVVVTFEIW